MTRIATTIRFWRKMGENGLFCQVDTATAQKVWSDGRLLNTNLFYTSNRLDWVKREPCRNDQDSNYDQILAKKWVEMAFFAKLTPQRLRKYGLMVVF